MHSCLDIVDEAGSFLGNIVAIVAVVDMVAYFVDRDQGFALNRDPSCNHAYERLVAVEFDSYLVLAYCSQIDLAALVVVVAVTRVIVAVVVVVANCLLLLLKTGLVAEIAVVRMQLMHYYYVTCDSLLLVAFVDPIVIGCLTALISGDFVPQRETLILNQMSQLARG